MASSITTPAHPLLTEPLRAFLTAMTRSFRPRLETLLAQRVERQRQFDAGVLPTFLSGTLAVRSSEWKIAPFPEMLADRRVEITGPVDRKMVINALNAGANVYMADFEDSSSPTWANIIEGQENLRDAVRRTIEFTAPETGKRYALAEKTATLFVRPRGLHLPEKHVIVDGKAIPGSFFDFGAFAFHNAKEQLARGAGPFFYLPKLESHLEARLWNDIFVFTEEALGIPQGSIKATVLIETLPAAFEMDEILYELRDHSAGLNCGRWDYIFSFIKKRRADKGAILPDRSQITMDRGFLSAYSRLLVKTCHRRGAHAMGGMAAQIPIKNDAEKNDQAFAKVRADKEREVKNGHDGTWVAHPGLVSLAREVFDANMAGANQIANLKEDTSVSEADLLAVPEGTKTDAALRHNIRVGLQYVEAWLRGLGCVPIYDLMEDAATAEISRAQIWQWIHHAAMTDDGVVVDRARFDKTLSEEVVQLKKEIPGFEAGRFEDASRIFASLATADTFTEFLTLPAYEQLP